MDENKTQPTGEDVPEFLESVQHPGRREDAVRLDGLFRRVTGFRPELWSTRIVGYGRYKYTYASGRSGVWPATGFSPRKANMVVYIMPGYTDYGYLLKDLGRHRLGRSCLYLGRLKNIDEEVLATLIRTGLADLNSHSPVTRT